MTVTAALMSECAARSSSRSWLVRRKTVSEPSQGKLLHLILLLLLLLQMPLLLLLLRRLLLLLAAAAPHVLLLHK